MSDSLFSVEGKTFVVTGSAGTVGMVLCRLIAERGAKVAAIDINPLGSSIERDAQGSKFYTCDITNGEALEDTAKKIEKDFGKIDVLINLVCTFGTGVKATELPYERWQTDMKINLDTYFLSCTVFGRHMAKSGGGNIINFASTASYSYVKGSYKASYCVGKASVVALTKTFAYEFAENKIRVNAVAPGFIDIRENVLKEGIDWEYSEREVDRINRVPLHKLAQIKDLLGPVVFLSCKASSYMTGQVLLVDGGFLLAN